MCCLRYAANKITVINLNDVAVQILIFDYLMELNQVAEKCRYVIIHYDFGHSLQLFLFLVSNNL